MLGGLFVPAIGWGAGGADGFDEVFGVQDGGEGDWGDDVFFGKGFTDGAKGKDTFVLLDDPDAAFGFIESDLEGCYGHSKNSFHAGMKMQLVGAERNRGAILAWE
jgi:hypothetical protein